MDNNFHGIIIRPAALDDLERLCALEQACSQNPWSRDGMADELSNPNSIFFVLQTPENQIIGFACSALILNELHILEVAVFPDYRNSGFGSMLINRLLSEASAKKAVRACLEVRALNRCAIRLYEKCGFKRDGTRKGYYQDGEDAVLMSKIL